MSLLARASLALALVVLVWLLLGGDAEAARTPVTEAAVGEVGSRTLDVVFERWGTSDVFTNGNLHERSCQAYTATKSLCGYTITGYAKRPLGGRYVSYVERGTVKVRCRSHCRAFRLSVTDRTELSVDRDAGAR